jgi:hypothetical protein
MFLEIYSLYLIVQILPGIYSHAASAICTIIATRGCLTQILLLDYVIHSICISHHEPFCLFLHYSMRTKRGLAATW